MPPCLGYNDIPPLGKHVKLLVLILIALQSCHYGWSAVGIKIAIYLIVIVKICIFNHTIIIIKTNCIFRIYLLEIVSIANLLSRLAQRPKVIIRSFHLACLYLQKCKYQTRTYSEEF